MLDLDGGRLGSELKNVVTPTRSHDLKSMLKLGKHAETGIKALDEECYSAFWPLIEKVIQSRYSSLVGKESAERLASILEKGPLSRHRYSFSHLYYDFSGVAKERNERILRNIRRTQDWMASSKAEVKVSNLLYVTF